MDVYTAYAGVYDVSGQTAFSLRMIPYLELLLTRHRPDGRTFLDLACGTGTLAAAMAAQGWQVFGIDASTSMLEAAREKAEACGVDVAWSRQDMRSFVLPSQVAVVTCLYDSLNYMLSPRDLGEAAAAIARILQPGGLFVCDLSTKKAFESWANQTFFAEGDGLALIHCFRYDGARRRATVDITGFVEDSNGLYRRFRERHEQWAPLPREVRRALGEAGLQLEGCYECFSLQPPSEQSLRTLWVSRKPGAPLSPGSL